MWRVSIRDNYRLQCIVHGGLPFGRSAQWVEEQWRCRANLIMVGLVLGTDNQPRLTREWFCCIRSTEKPVAGENKQHFALYPVHQILLHFCAHESNVVVAT